MTGVANTATFNRLLPWLPRFMSGAHDILPGLCLCIFMAALAGFIGWLEKYFLKTVWLEPFVLSILIGSLVRTRWNPGPSWLRGINFSAKIPLEVGVALLGASVNAATLMSIKLELLMAIVVVVILSIALSLSIGRILRLPLRISILVACGNSICGNSAIAAVAPIIKADGDDVAASIAFTAVLGLLVVLGLPLFGRVLQMNALPFGALCGLMIYSVPQVLSAAAPFGSVAVQVGALVKLIRVLMLGPVCLAIALVFARLNADSHAHHHNLDDWERKDWRVSRIFQFFPWFILTFLVLLVLRGWNLIPATFMAPAATLSNGLTLVAMAALGLGVDLRVAMRAGPRVTAMVVTSLIALGCLSVAAVKMVVIG